MSRRTATLIVALYVFSLAAVAAAKGATTIVLHRREHRQIHSLHHYESVLIFFRRHHRLAHTRTGYIETRRARIWVRVIRRELRETKAALRPPKPDPFVQGPFPIDPCTAAILPREGGMNPHAQNPKSGAYGGPQALPGSKMASAGPDWRDNIWTQIKWMIGYETQRYGSPCAALAAWNRQGWY